MKKSGLYTVKSNNMALVLGCLQNGPVSRTAIVRRTGLSKGSVTRIVNDFIAAGQLTEQGTETPVGIGRPQVGIGLVADFRFIVGISLHRTTLAVCLADLAGHAVDSVTLPVTLFSKAEQALDTLWERLQEMLCRHSIPPEKLIGIGVSCPGPLDYRNGTILTPPGMALFHRFPVKAYLAQRSTLPVFLDNNAVLLALTEDSRGDLPNRNYLFVVVSDGVGSAIVSGHQVYRGYGGFSGELGHMSVDPEGRACECGNRGCLERYITQAALRERFGFADYSALVDRAYAGEPKALAVLDDIAHYFAPALVNAVNLMDLDAIVIYGELNYRSELLFDKLRTILENRSMVARMHPVTLQPSRIPADGDVAFATAAIRKAYFEQRLSEE